MSSQIMWLVFWTLILIAKFVLAGAYEDKTEVHIAYLGARKHNDVKLTTASHIDLLKSLLGSKKDARESMIYSYKHGFSGFAAHLTSSQAKKLSEHPDVVQVTRDSYYEPQTTRTYDFLGLSQSNPEGLLLQARMGEDIIIGFVDSGVWPESESFNDRGLGPIPERWKGKCMDGQDFDSKKHCNRKLIGARYYLKKKRTSGTDYMSARESVAHGTHVASIAGGSLVPNVSDKGLGVGTVRGGAPSARIAVYKACWKGEEEKSCEYSDILKAMDDAIYDGVDVLSISLASAIPILTETNRLDEISYGAFHAISKGIPVICAGGNSGPGAYTVFNIAPWIITVAATTLDRWFPTPLTLGNNVTLLARTAFKGREIQGGLIYVENAKEITSALKGKVVLVFVTADGGDSGPEFIEASTDAELKALIIADKIQDFNVIVTDIPPILINIDYEQGTTMMKYIGSTSLPTIKISSAITLTGPLVATKVADFSGRGPNSVSPYVLKVLNVTFASIYTQFSSVLMKNPTNVYLQPDIAAPGVAIVAATTPLDPGAQNGYVSKSGTSMSTPVVAGVVALLRAVHPDWSPAALRSAIVTTASTTDPYGEPIFADGMSRKLADPFDFGGGLVNPNRAADPGLVYDAGEEDYLLFLCASGYDQASIKNIANRTEYECPIPLPSMLDLNLPSITIPFLKEDVTLTRTVTNVGPVNSVYTVNVQPPLGIEINVTPSILIFCSSVKQLSFSVTVSTTHKANSIYYFGSLTWTDISHKVTIPISVRTQMLMYFDL